MKIGHFGSLFVVVATSVMLSQSSDDYLIDFTLSTDVAREGESLSAVCDVTNEGKGSFFIIWVKTTVDSNEQVEIATSGHVNRDFNNTGRYAASYLMETPGDTRKLKYFLNISNLHSEDSGSLSCKRGSKEAKQEDIQFKPFHVQVPVHKIWWTSSDENEIYSDGETMFLKEGDIQQFACHINGSYPEATVQVFLGHDDITDLFEVKSSLKSSEGPQGLKPVFYRTDVISKSTVIGYHNMTKMLKCVAKVSASDVSKVASINVNLTEYSPKFQCDEKMQAKLYEQYFNLTCRVHASPGVTDAKFHWISRDNDNDTLEVGEKSSDISANMTEGESKDEVVMVMTIYRVASKHFQRKYIFEAENDVRRVKHIIQLEQDMSPEFNLHSGRVCSLHSVKMTVLMLLWALISTSV